MIRRRRLAQAIRNVKEMVGRHCRQMGSTPHEDLSIKDFFEPLEPRVLLSGSAVTDPIILDELEVEVLITEDRPGDADGDSFVDATDLNILAVNWHKPVTGGISDADFDESGFVNATDLNILALNWHKGPLDLTRRFVVQAKLLEPTIEGGTALLEFSVRPTSIPARITPVIVSYSTESRDAEVGEDFDFRSGQFVLNENTRSHVVPINLREDGVFEGDEKFVVVADLDFQLEDNGRIIGGLDPTLRPVITIQDNEPLPTVSINDVRVLEGDGGTRNANFTMSLDIPSKFDIRVRGVTSRGTARESGAAGAGEGGSNPLNPEDFVSTNRNVTFSPGEQSRPYTVEVNGDHVFEGDPDAGDRVEDFFVNLALLSSSQQAQITDNQGRGVIIDDDDIAHVTIDDVSVVEGDAGQKVARFRITREGAIGRPVNMLAQTIDGAGTATPNVDYCPNSGSIDFGETGIIRHFEVCIIGDTAVEGPETFPVQLSGAPSHVRFNRALATGTILEDDLRMTISDVTVTEPNLHEPHAIATFDINLSQDSPGGVKVTVVELKGITATPDLDFVNQVDGQIMDPFPRPISIPDGESKISVSVKVIGDAIIERTETFSVELGFPINARLDDPIGIGTILDNDLPVVQQVGVAQRDRVSNELAVGITWLLDNDQYGGAAEKTFHPFGLSNGAAIEHIPIPLDFDGDGFTEIAVADNNHARKDFFPGFMLWYIDSNHNGAADENPSVIAFGLTDPAFGHIPLPGNWRLKKPGDELAVLQVRAGGGYDLLIDVEHDGIGAEAVVAYPLIEPGDVPVVGDWDNDGIDELGVVRRNFSSGLLDWHLDYNGDGSQWEHTISFGLSGTVGNPSEDIPVVGNWNGLGGDEVGVVRPNRARGGLDWHLSLDNNGVDPDRVLEFGLADWGHIPVVGDWGKYPLDNPG